MQQPGRSYSAGNQYRYGFNGKENDNEIKGTGNQQDYWLRIYDLRIGKFLSVDPLTKNYPFYSPYQFAGNDIIRNVDLDGTEPVEKGKECGQYSIAQIQDSKDKKSYGWTWDTDDNKWHQQSPTLFQNGSTTSEQAKAKDKDGDTKYGDNPPSPNINVTRLNATKTSNELYLTLKTALAFGTSGVNSAVGAEMADHFATGGGIDRVAENGTISREISRDSRFQKYAEAFEKKALEYFSTNKTLEGFNGAKYLRNRVNFDIRKGSSLFLHTLIGGTQGVSAMITMITENEIKVTYNLFDVFGAGRSDGSRLYPGLQSAFVLQHYRNLSKDTKDLFRPFFWRVEIKR